MEIEATNRLFYNKASNWSMQIKASSFKSWLTVCLFFFCFFKQDFLAHWVHVLMKTKTSVWTFWVCFASLEERFPISHETSHFWVSANGGFQLAISKWGHLFAVCRSWLPVGNVKLSFSFSLCRLKLLNGFLKSRDKTFCWLMSIHKT